ncbi:MAG TPA: hypothetical protein VNW97_10020 [Candidatus Saccharimonadales bacterium]|nr:hypothetical protein [Candidatus Saccharimonadales bacterium]
MDASFPIIYQILAGVAGLGMKALASVILRRFRFPLSVAEPVPPATPALRTRVRGRSE